MDPLGQETGAFDPFLIISDPNYSDVHGDVPMFVDGGDPFHLSDGCGDIDGMPASCSEISDRMRDGSVETSYPGVMINDQNGRRPDQRPVVDYGLGLFSMLLPDGNNEISGERFFFTLPQKSDSFRNAVEKTFDRAAKILEGNSDCAKFFGPHAKEALEAMRQKIQVFPKSGGPGGVDTGISQSGYPGGVNAIPSGPYRMPGAFTVYTNGPFFMQGNGAIAGYKPGTEMAQNAAILHELAHNIKNATGDGFLIPNDGPGTKQGLSQQNTDLIKRKCGNQIFKGH
jgi:hypothetical protein